MAALKSVWGIDIGQCALKALKLREVDGQLQAEAFDIIEHARILSQPDADRPQLVRSALEQFLSHNDVSNSTVVISVPGQSSFTRFVKLPPVDPKRVADIVRFEAEQQIPFDINEVIWRWQAFQDSDSPDIEVGLFAIKRNDVYNALAPFQEATIGVDAVQMAPLALYNFMTYDQQVAPDGATLLVDIGADSTNLVVSDGPRLWTRTIQLGGNNFTEALVKAFKLSFSKAEKLKRTAATSKYARQIFQAMRPIFADLVQEIQRSIGYYTSLHREARFKRLVGMGNGFRLPGLQKFLEQNLNVAVVRIDNFNALQASTAISVPDFTENLLSFAVAYGLALQGLELTRIDTNLLPEEIASGRRWTRKRPWFAAAAVLIVVAMLGLAFRGIKDGATLSDDSPELAAAQAMQSKYGTIARQYNSTASEAEAPKASVQQFLKVTGYRGFWVNMLQVISQSIASEAKDQALAADWTKAADLAKIDSSQRRELIVSKLETTYIPDLGAPNAQDLGNGTASSGGPPTAGPMGGPGIMAGPPTGFGGPGGPPPGFGGPGGTPPGLNAGGGAAGPAASSSDNRGFRIILSGRSPMDRAGATAMLNNLLHNSKQIAEKSFGDQIEVVKADIISFREVAPGAGDMAGPAGMPPGAMPPGMSGPGSGNTNALDITGRSFANDTQFEIGWIVKIKGDGITAPSTPNP